MDIGGQDVMIRVVNSAKSMRIIIPADSLFKVGAAKTSQYFLRVMQRPLALILYHPELNIKVEAYTDNVLLGRNAQRLTDEQSEFIAAYLWSNGIDLSRLHYIGGGSNNAVSSNRTAIGSYANRRIELSLY